MVPFKKNIQYKVEKAGSKKKGDKSLVRISKFAVATSLEIWSPEVHAFQKS